MSSTASAKKSPAPKAAAIKSKPAVAAASGNKKRSASEAAESGTASASASKKKRAADASESEADAPAAETGSPAKKLKTTAAAPSKPLSAKEIDAFKAKLVKSVVKAIKKTGHSDRNSPWSSVELGISSKELALEVLGDVGGKVTSSTANTERREVHGRERITKWLGLDEYRGMIHPVKFSGTSFGGALFS
jgi:hypothetical protein